MYVETYSDRNFSSLIPPTPEHYVTGAVYALISVFGITGNIVVILAVLRHRNLQNSTNAFIVNLAVADLLTNVFVHVYVASFWTTMYTSLMDKFCALSVGLLRASVTCSTLSLVAISLNRLVIVTQARRIYRWFFARRRIIISIFFMWIYGLLLSFSTHFMGLTRLGFDVRIHQCGLVLINQYSVTIGHRSHAIGTFPLQFFIVLVCYAWIYVFVYCHNKRMQKRATREPVCAISGHDRTRTNISSKSRTAAFSKQVDITKNLFYILCAFVICLFPQLVCSLLGCVNIFTKTFVLVNSMVNPFIYGLNHPQFRKAFASMFAPSRNSTIKRSRSAATSNADGSRISSRVITATSDAFEDNFV